MTTQLKIFLLAGVILFCNNVGFSQSYEKSEDTYVMVLDIQTTYTTNAMSEGQAESLLKATNKVIEKTKPENIVYIKSFAQVAYLTLKGLVVDTLPHQELDERLKVVNEQIFTKEEGDAFATKEITNFFEQNEVKKIVVVGLMAEQCVSHTLLGGIEKSFEMYVIPEAIAAKSEKSKEKVLDKLEKKGIQILHL